MKLKVYAKLNLTLDVTGRDGAYHALSSLCCSVDLFDEITVNRAEKITLDCPEIPLPPEKNNAYLAAQAFFAAFGEGGAAIGIKKGIPVGGGLGGSTADIVGTAKALSLLYGKPDVLPLVNGLCSDGAFMLTGGFGVMEGRGDRVRFLPYRELFFVLIPVSGGVPTGKCFALSDEMEKQPPVTEKAVEALLSSGEIFPYLKNDLYPAAKELLPEIGEAFSAIGKTRPLCRSMSGSGSTVFGIYRTRKEAERACFTLKEKYPQAVAAASVPCGVEVTEK